MPILTLTRAYPCGYDEGATYKYDEQEDKHRISTAVNSSHRKSLQQLAIMLSHFVQSIFQMIRIIALSYVKHYKKS